MTPLVDVRHLVKEFPGRGGLFARGTPVRAVDDVSFSIATGETLGPRRRIGIGQDDDRALHPAANRALVGRSTIQGSWTCSRSARASCARRGGICRSCFRIRTRR